MKSKSEYHIVAPSPWPIFTSFSVCGLLIALAFLMHGAVYSTLAFASFFLLVITCMFCWWKDVIVEAITDGAHTNIVKKGLRIGMIFFIFSEAMFFFVFFWSFFKSWLDPVSVMQDLWPVSRLDWPPEGIKIIDAWNIPFLNTLILLLSGTTVTWAHYALLNKDNRSLIKGLAITVFLGFCFVCLQAYEYYHAPFLFNEEGYKSIYSSNFYIATGFHGLHVLIGAIFLTVCLVRAMRNQITIKDHLGFEFAAWYWHFVDVVWLLLFTFLYWLSDAIRI